MPRAKRPLHCYAHTATLLQDRINLSRGYGCVEIVGEATGDIANHRRKSCVARAGLTDDAGRPWGTNITLGGDVSRLLQFPIFGWLIRQTRGKTVHLITLEDGRGLGKHHLTHA